MGLDRAGPRRRLGGGGMTPTIGRIVIFKLTEDHAKQINRRRTNSEAIARRIAKNDPSEMSSSWPIGAQAHIGNAVSVGDEFPLLIVRVWSATTINGQAFLDGNDSFWVTSAQEGSENGQWHWPERV